MKRLLDEKRTGLLLALLLSALSTEGMAQTMEMKPVGWIRKAEGQTSIQIAPDYADALLGVDALEFIWVLYWLDRNDTPEQRAILQVHPRGNPANPLRGVFATRAPVRPNLIGLSRCRVLSVQGNVVLIDEIDAYADTPVVDIKPYRDGR